MSDVRVVFWGTRGSIPRTVRPSDIRGKLRSALMEALAADLSGEDEVERFIASRLSFDVGSTYGGATPCVEIRGGEELLVLDAGSGFRELGARLMSSGKAAPLRTHLLMSHFHWDHVQGFPFYIPAYIPGNEIHIYGYHDGIEDVFVRQQEPPFFPVPFSAMGASVSFHKLDLEGTSEIAGFRIRGFLQHHPGDSYAYALERDGVKVVYSTDSEHYDDAYEEGYPYVDFIRDADLLIFDAAYTLADQVVNKKDWGHSNNLIGVELAARAGVRHLCLFHHDHMADDETLEQIRRGTVRYAEVTGSDHLEVDVAYDGMEVAL